MPRLCEFCGEPLPELKVGRPSPATCYWNAAAELRHAGGGLYVEGWAVRFRNGQPGPFEHGWVELDGKPHDVTPHNHAAEYFPALRFADPGQEPYLRGVDIPFYRALTCPCDADGNPNPKYEAELARAYAAARLAADDFCRRQVE